MFFGRSTQSSSHAPHLIAAIIITIFALAAVETWLATATAGAPAIGSANAAAHIVSAVDPGLVPAADPMLAGDPANGAALFKAFQPKAGISCISCHRSDSEARLVGPGLLNVGIRAASRVSGLSAEEYLHQSIVDPSAYVVAGYADAMPKSWGKVFTAQQLADLAAYLMTLK